MNISELDDALSAALHALSAAQATLRKGASARDLDILRKGGLAEPKDDPSAEALAKLAAAEKRIERLEAQRDYEAQHAPRKTMRYEETRS